MTYNYYTKFERASEPITCLEIVQQFDDIQKGFLENPIGNLINLLLENLHVFVRQQPIRKRQKIGICSLTVIQLSENNGICTASRNLIKPFWKISFYSVNTGLPGKVQKRCSWKKEQIFLKIVSVAYFCFGFSLKKSISNLIVSLFCYH